MKHPPLTLPLLSAALALAGCEAPEAPVGSSRQAIVAGALDTGDPAIMEVLAFRGNTGARCTASLITPRVLLLAAHCFVETPGFEYSVFPGSDDRSVTTDQEVLPIEAHAYDTRYSGNPRQGHDFGIVVLRNPLPIRPLRINRAPLDQAQGKSVRYVGYGLTTIGDRSSGGIKRHNTAPLAQVTGLLLSIAANAHNACEGDSGGPLLIDDGQGEAIAGVGSFVVNPACRRDSFYQRLDTQLDWLDEQLKKYDSPAAPPGTSSDGGAAADAAPALPPDAAAPDLPPAPPPDAAAPVPPPAPDAAASAPAPPAVPPPSSFASADDGGCSYAPGRAGSAGAGLGAGSVLLALRRRRRSGRADGR
jgi:V8-like Glu-specific endopeptidase